MQIDIVIDKLTPCLVDIATGKVLQTTFSLAKPDEILDLQSKGWNFDWSDRELARCNVYKLQLENDDEIQGLVATEFSVERCISVLQRVHRIINCQIRNMMESVGISLLLPLSYR